jgi:CcmD family protein
MSRRIGMALVTACLSAAVLVLLAVPVEAARQAPAGQTEFVPVEQLPPTEQLPAAPLLVAAYVFVWLAAMFYIWSVWRRLSRVERELHELERRRPQRSTRT